MHFSVRIRTKGSDSKSPNGIRSSPVSGRLVVQRIQGHQTQTIADGPVTLDKDLEVISLRDTPTQGGLAVYEAKFVADDPESDSYQQNNNASGICDVVDEGKILIVTTGEQTEPIQKRFGFLSEHGIHFEVRPDTASFANISDLLQFDAVVLANTPRMETVEGLPLLRYANEQLVDLKTYVHDFGGGLIMTGGPKSMGAGHWMNTPVEEAMPVRFQVDNEKIVSIGALALVIDKSGSMDGDKIAMSVAAAIQAVSMLSDSDYVGIYPFDSDLVQAVPLQKIAGNRPRIQRSIRRIGAGGGTDMTRALDTAYRDLQKNSASLKHVIVLTDGQTAGSNFESLARDMHRRGITTSAVAVGDSTDAKLLQAIARNGNGQFYQVNNPNAIPRIFMKETRMLSKPLVREFESTVPVERRISHEIVQGLPSPPPGIRGLVRTTSRENVLAEQILRSEQPESPNDTLLAAWQFGSGRSAAWTTDLGERWAGAWNDSGGMDPLLVQMLRWVRRQQVNHNHLVRVTTSDNTTRVSLQWDDAIPDVPNAVACMITRIGTDEIHRPAFDRTGPRQFETSLQSLPTGNYALAIDTGGEEGVIVQGFSVRDNQEFITHPNALRDLVEIAGIGSQSATVLRNGSTTSPSQSIAILAQEQRWIDGTNFGGSNGSNPNAPGTTLDLFRPTAMKDRSLTSTWPLLLLLAGMLLLAEIAGRKFGWDRWVSADLKPRNVLPRMEADFTRSERSVSRPPSGKPQVALAPEESLTYTGRLLKSKKESQGKN